CVAPIATGPCPYPEATSVIVFGLFRGEVIASGMIVAPRQLERGDTVGDEVIVGFLNWLTDGGRMRLGYNSQQGQPDELWLGAKQVSRSDLARVARHWPGGVNLTHESAGALVGLALERVSASVGREWRPVA